AVASAEAPRESRSRWSKWSKRVIIEPRFSPDQPRQINDLPAAEVLAKDKSLLTVTAKRVIWAPLYRTSVESCPTSTCTSIGRRKRRAGVRPRSASGHVGGWWGPRSPRAAVGHGGPRR